LDKGRSDVRGLAIELHPRKVPAQSENMMMEVIEEPLANIMNNKLNQEISKLIKMYSA
jgi:hypothetical protein